TSYTHLAYDEHGNLVLNELDIHGDGIVDERLTWLFAPGGGLERFTWTFDDITQEVALQYDDDDRLASATWTSSTGVDGRADYEYLDAARRVVERKDRDSDGAVDETVTYTYDAEGNLQGFTSACQGEAEPRAITTVQRDAAGRVLRIETRRGEGHGEATDYFYDQDGLLEGVGRLQDESYGTFTYMETYERDPDGNVIGKRVHLATLIGGEIVRPFILDRTYDTEGRILSAQVTYDGELSDEQTYLYECPDREDSSGRRVGAPPSPLASPPTGPRGKVNPETAYGYLFDSTCS
ncbi:MAG TPA: hypothetical protein VNM90_09165, partial [Haliangium sp.]|nr:hypothetical protein [Haliangium sp.]